MAGATFSDALFRRMPIVGVVRHLRSADWPDLLEAYRRSGLTTIEVTMNTAGAPDMIRWAAERFGDSLNIGAGTVCTLDELHQAADAGAGFIVTPVLTRDVIVESCRMGLPVFPGAFTPTEIREAWTLGASLVKVFPAAPLGPAYIRAVKAPFPDMQLMPTGGIGIADVAAYRRAGADALGIGSPLFPDDLLRRGDWAALAEHFEHFVNNWNTAP